MICLRVHLVEIRRASQNRIRKAVDWLQTIVFASV